MAGIVGVIRSTYIDRLRVLFCVVNNIELDLMGE